MKNIYIVDTETTGVSNSDQVIELAWFKITNEVNNLAILDSFQSYYNPTVPIHPRAYAVNGLRKDMLSKYPLTTSLKLPEIDIIICHNAAFDTRMLSYKGKSICTQKLVKKIEKMKGIQIAKDHHLRTLYTLFNPNGASFGHYHNATQDCHMTLHVLRGLLTYLPHIETLEQLESWM
jgi:DNA polymerase III epsilon subunit-like protein